jgi:hypothetical protein
MSLFYRAAEPNKQYLTYDRHSQLNKLVTDLNLVIKVAVRNANYGRTYGNVVFVPISDLFGGHRFCETGTVEPDNQTLNT